jgi:hypothetical protein
MFHESNPEGGRVLYRMALDSGAQATLLAKGNFAGGFESGDGRFMIYTVSNPTTGLDVVALPLFGSGTPVALAASSTNEYVSSISNDGRWVTISDLQGGSSVVRRLITDGNTPTLGGTFSLGSDIASPAMLRSDGAEVFFVTADGSLKSVTLTPAGDGLTLGPPRTLFKLPAGDGSFSPSAHGNEFVVHELPFARGQTLRVLTNWEKRVSK